MIQITVKLFASLRNGRFKEEVRSYATPVTSGVIAEELGIQPKVVGIVLRNGAVVSLDNPLLDGDQLSLMPRISGG